MSQHTVLQFFICNMLKTELFLESFLIWNNFTTVFKGWMSTLKIKLRRNTFGLHFTQHVSSTWPVDIKMHFVSLFLILTNMYWFIFVRIFKKYIPLPTFYYEHLSKKEDHWHSIKETTETSVQTLVLVTLLQRTQVLVFLLRANSSLCCCGDSSGDSFLPSLVYVLLLSFLSLSSLILHMVTVLYVSYQQ